MTALPGRGYAALRRRPTLAAALIYAALSLLLVAPALLPGKTLSNSDTLWFEPPWRGVKPAALESPSNSELGDAPGQLQPFLKYTADRLPDIPLWNPHIVAGRPFLANFQSAIFSPYSLPAYVLPFWTALGWIAVLKLWVAAFGMYLLGRSLGMRFGGALLAGVVYAFSLWMVTWLSYPHMSVWTAIPWLMLLTDRLVRRPDLLSAGALAAVVALQFFAGHPESSFHALFATSLFLVLRLVQARRDATPKPTLARPLLAFGAAVLGGAALAALTIIPFTELLLGSADLHDRQGESVDLQPIFSEFFFGIFMPDFWGKPTGTPIRFFVLDRALYVGALPLLLGVVALTLHPTLERLSVAVFGAVWLAVLFGIQPILAIVTRLPVFSGGHNSRLSVFFALAMALLAGWGLDDLTEGRGKRRKRRVALAIGGVLFLVPVVWVVEGGRTTLSVFGDALEVAWGFATPPGAVVDLATGGRKCADPCTEAADVVGLAALLGWLVLAGAALALVALRVSRRLGPSAFVVLAILLVCADLFRAGMGYNPAIDRDFASQPATGAIRYLEGRGLARYVAKDEIPQNVVSMRFGLYEARGYDLPIPRRFDRLWRSEVSPESASVSKGLLDVPLTVREVTPRALRVLRLLGVTDLMQAADVPPLLEPGLRLVYNGPDARVYRIAGALPRAQVVSAQRVVDGEAAARDAVSSPAFDARAVAVTEERLPGLATERAGATADGGSATIESYEPERVVVRVRSRGEGLLVLGDSWYPGWKATVDGRAADVERVDYVLRGVRVGPGSHAVEFRYEPLSWRVGWIVSLTALLGLGAVLLVGRRRRQSSTAPSG